MANERIRLFFQVNSVQGLRSVRYLHIMAISGAIAIGSVTRILAGTPIVNLAGWCCIVFLCESLITIVNRSFQHRERTPGELIYWAWGKTALSACNGCA